MNTTPQCILELRQCYPELTGSYRRLADYVLAAPEEIIKCKAKDAARACNCDESAVIRFCQKIGYSGFPAFKAAMMADFIPLRLNSSRKRAHGDSSGIKHDFLENYTKTMNDTINLLDEAVVKHAAELIGGAGKIILLGTGSSGIVAQDAQVKLMRLGFNVVFQQDANLTMMMLGLLNPDDVVLAISYTGATQLVCDAVEKARKKQAKIISITNYPQSPLAKKSDITLLTASDEKVFRLGAMTSRIAQCIAIDFLVLHLVTENLGKSQEYITKTHAMLDRD